ncbi:MAG: hypothetical protein IH594_10955, partial [Bacteroidales bacterium]|nr:hypothetical protein [Bacteroidales bacterium]
MLNTLKARRKKLLEDKKLSVYNRFSSTIYGRVVFILGISFIVLFLLFNLVFRSVYVDIFNNTVRQNGDHISSIVEGALYYSMLENDKSMLQQTLDVISTMSGIDEVNMYDQNNQLAYTSLPADIENRGNPNCNDCHSDLGTLFSDLDRSYRIVTPKEDCGVFHQNTKERHLLIREPIYNERSCYTSGCHAHSPDDLILGSLIINLPLGDMDEFLTDSSTNFFLLALLITGFLILFLILFTRKRIKDPLNSIIVASE